MVKVTPNYSARMLKVFFIIPTMKLSHVIFLIGIFFSIVVYAQPQSVVTGTCLYGLDDSGLIQNGFKLDSIQIIEASDRATSRMTFKYNNSGNLYELCVYDKEVTEKRVHPTNA